MKTVFITGASKGIGKETAELFRSKGYNVIAPGRQELDLSDISNVENFIKNFDCNADILINNAGINPIMPLEDISYKDLLNVFNTNLFSAVLLSKAFSKNMKKSKSGKIINISSIWSIVSKPNRMIYAASKAAINSITQTLALELGNYGILVNALAPGFVNTELTKQNNSKEQIESLKKYIPLKRLAEPKEVAKAVLFLASDDNTFITGQTILIDGGFSCQ